MIIRIYDAGQRNRVRSGYGLMARQLSAHLGALGHEVRFFPDTIPGEDVVLWIRPPHYVKDQHFDPKKKNVFFTMHEKETFEGWKKDWPELLNRCTAIITPTQWNKDVFINHGVTVPIHVLPLGIDIKMFHGYQTYEFSIMTLHDNLGSPDSRENWKDTIAAYYQAFHHYHHQEVTLSIKSYNIKQTEYQQTLLELQRPYDTTLLPPINIINLDLESQDLNLLYAKHWVFIKNANREGWSLPAWEALAAGCRLIYTDLPVFSNLLETRARRFSLGNVGELADILRDEFKHWRREKAFLSQYSWKSRAQEVERVLLSV